MRDSPSTRDAAHDHLGIGQVGRTAFVSAVDGRQRLRGKASFRCHVWSLIGQTLENMANAGSLDHLVRSLDALVFGLDQLGSGCLLDRYMADGSVLPATARAIVSLRAGAPIDAVLRYLRGETTAAGADAIVNDLRHVLPMLFHYETRPEMATMRESEKALSLHEDRRLRAGDGAPLTVAKAATTWKHPTVGASAR